MTSEQLNFLKTAFRYAEKLVRLNVDFTKISEGSTQNKIIATYEMPVSKFNDFAQCVNLLKYHIEEYDLCHCGVDVEMVNDDFKTLYNIEDLTRLNQYKYDITLVCITITAKDRYSEILGRISDNPAVGYVKTWCNLANEQTAAQTALQILSEAGAQGIEAHNYTKGFGASYRQFPFIEATCEYRGSIMRAKGHGETEALLALLDYVLNYEEPSNELMEMLFGK
jgi:hypothetical protein